jgi:hypothetical protein
MLLGNCRYNFIIKEFNTALLLIQKKDPEIQFFPLKELEEHL